MDLNGLFQSPSVYVDEFAQMQVHLYRSDPTLQDYFLPIQLDMPLSRSVHGEVVHPTSRPLLTWAMRGADRMSRFGTRQKIKADVLLCPMPYFSRRTENEFLARTLIGLAQTGAKILCLLPSNAPCRDELDAQLKAAGRTGQVIFIDPTACSNRVEAGLRARLARARGKSAFERVVSILEPLGLCSIQGAKNGFEQIADFVEGWERLAPQLEFDAVVARCHWQALCSPVCRTAQLRGKPVVTFQQGVIGHTLDAPVTASRFVSFGQASGSFLAQTNRRFFQAVGTPEPPVEYVNAGCMFDKITVLPNQFDRQSLLMVDVPMAQDDFYGTEGQCSALLQLGERLLKSNVPLRRLIIRPHPYWSNLNLEECKRLVREHPDHCEISHPSWSLEDDLRRSSVALGIFSGVLTVASACGLPTIFLESELGYKTADLDCFSHGQMLMPDSAFCRISKMLSDQHAYREAREEALRNAREYYAGGANADLDAAFFSRLLESGPLTNQVQVPVQ